MEDAQSPVPVDRSDPHMKTLPESDFTDEDIERLRKMLAELRRMH